MNTLVISDPPVHDGADEGERLRDAALARLAQLRREVMRRLQRAAVQIAIQHGCVCANQVRAVVPIPVGVSANVNGAAFRHLALARILRPDGFSQSCRPQDHASTLRVWTLADRAAAEKWLVDHPELQDANGAGGEVADE
jgi:hypothetical protein